MRNAAGVAEAAGITPVCLLGTSALRVWNEPPAERLKRSFARAGTVSFIEEPDLGRHQGPVVLVRADCVLDTPLIKPLLATPGILLRASGGDGDVALAAHAPAGEAPSAAALLQRRALGPSAVSLRPITSAELGSSYWEKLRKREAPYALQVTGDTLADTEWRIFMGTYKGATDFVTKWLWPWPAFQVTKLCARWGVTPNMVTLLSLLLVIAAFFWFLAGAWLPGLVAAWVMTFLDTVDGKLARVTLQSSKFGDVLDHGIDLIHPPFWYVAWGIGLGGAEGGLARDTLVLVLTVIVVGYLLQRAIEGLSLLLFKIEIHVWRPIDTLFRQITARRNPNLVLLTVGALAGHPEAGLIAVALWTAVCLALHGLQMMQAAWAWRRQGKLESWMSKPA